jgi:enamine deaminase RidA (YjgF/YER057c/UK114 family)
LPASTGISGNNPEGSACALDLFAIKTSPGSTVSTARLTNPVQNEAPVYGSAFSRAVVVRQPDCSLIEVSGTAAIDAAGKSLYPGDIDAQIVCTLDKIEALIAQEKAGLADICAATVFVKKPEFAERFRKLSAERGLNDFPCVLVVADVCRAELLFEIDAEAAITPS